jgi:hypothetical protein
MAGRLGFTDLGDQFVDRASRFEVGDGEMLEAIKELDSVGPAVGNVGKAMSILARKIDDEMPLDAKVTRVAEAVTRSLSAAAAAAELIGPTIRKSHFHDIHRSEAPRPGEKGWNVR